MVNSSNSEDQHEYHIYIQIRCLYLSVPDIRLKRYVVVMTLVPEDVEASWNFLNLCVIYALATGVSLWPAFGELKFLRWSLD